MATIKYVVNVEVVENYLVEVQAAEGDTGRKQALRAARQLVKDGKGPMPRKRKIISVYAIGGRSVE